ncbi:MAG TPA: hypothetical protein VJ783_07505 [Pirellulales bacterium]|nr:hypothetical protein [Pirellulales bacterium]
MIEESDTFLAILEQGEERATRELIIRLGEDRLGPADASAIGQPQAITDLPRLKRIAVQAPKVLTWRQLLQTP